MTLTATQIKYLLTIHTLNNKNIIRSSDIAELLGVTKPTVHSMLTQLSALNLITKEKYSVITLTEYGRKTALQCYNAFKSVKPLLRNQLKLPSNIANEGALAILSCLKPEEMNLPLSDSSYSKTDTDVIEQKDSKRILLNE